MNPEEIHAIRQNLGLTLAEFSRLLGVSLGTAWNWCSGRNSPGIRNVRALRSAQKLSPEKAAKLLKKHSPGLPEE